MAELEFSQKVNCLVGDNGVGKTNILDAIYYLSFCRSFFNAIDVHNITYDEPFFLLQGEYERGQQVENIACSLKRKQKKQVKRNQKEYQKLSEHIGLLPVVMVSPADNALISDGSEERRRYIDGVISQYDRNYLNALIQYNKVLQQRNAHLKQLSEKRVIDNGLLEVFNGQLNSFGEIIYRARSDFFENLLPVFQAYYSSISMDREQVMLSYETCMNQGDYQEQLSSATARDVLLGYTSKGVHKDDLIFYLGEHPIKRVGSQGQQKTFLIALKLAQYEFIKKVNGFSPILLLDDIFDKLDSSRVASIIKLVSKDLFGQIFITDTNKDHLLGIIEKMGEEYRIFHVRSGENIALIK
jgi:DNA replication and repair protein RecF